MVAMYAIHARYRGLATTRKALVQQAAAALTALTDGEPFEFVGIEDIRTTVTTAEQAFQLAAAVLTTGEWSVGIGISSSQADKEPALNLATAAIKHVTKPGVVKCKLGKRSPAAATAAQAVSNAFLMLAYLLARRTDEGREATSLMRKGMTQKEAAAQLGISKQAMSQRLAAAAWTTEVAALELILPLLEQAALIADGYELQPAGKASTKKA